MLETVKKDGARLSATELLKDAQPMKPRPDKTLHRLTSIERIQRIYHAVRERVAAIGHGLRHRQEIERA